jgi:hypothetical protein
LHMLRDGVQSKLILIQSDITNDARAQCIPRKGGASEHVQADDQKPAERFREFAEIIGIGGFLTRGRFTR